MVRVNAVGTGLEQADLEAVVSRGLRPLNQIYPLSHQLPSRHIEALALPKTTTPEHMRYLIAQIEKFAPREKHAGGQRALKVIAMIENARGMMGLKEIIEAGRGYIDGLLVRPSRRCHSHLSLTDTSRCLVDAVRVPLISSLQRKTVGWSDATLSEPYSRVRLRRCRHHTHAEPDRDAVPTITASHCRQGVRPPGDRPRACPPTRIRRVSYSSQVCVNYKDEAALREESEEGRRLGFEGKVRNAAAHKCTS